MTMDQLSALNLIRVQALTPQQLGKLKVVMFNNNAQANTFLSEFR